MSTTKIPPIELKKRQFPIENSLNFVGVDSKKQKYKGKDIVIAVLDSGCDVSHRDLKDNIIGGYNFTNDYNSNPSMYIDNNGHGTHVSGIISGKNYKYEIGIAPESKLLILKVLDSKGEGEISNLIKGIEYAINWRGTNGEKVRIINLSLGALESNEELYKIIKKAINMNISVVVSSGNDGDGDQKTKEYRYPAAYNEVIQVGAIDFSDNVAYFSNINNEIDIYAPGVNILSTYLNDSYRILSGTSMAAPFISGSLALIIEEKEFLLGRELSECEIYAQLIKKTRSLKIDIDNFINGAIFLKEN